MNMTAFNAQMAELQRDIALMAIGYTAISILATIAMFWGLYVAIKCGVRDGIRDARHWSTPPVNTADPTGAIPPMRAER